MAKKPSNKNNAKTQEETLPGITGITVKGFKSIAEETHIEIRPLTLLAGANSSGKSSIMQPLLLLKQTLEAPYDPGPLLLDGHNVQFSSADQLLSRSDSQKTSRIFSVGLEIANFAETVLSFTAGRKESFALTENKHRFRKTGARITNGAYEELFEDYYEYVSLTPGMAHKEIKEFIEYFKKISPWSPIAILAMAQARIDPKDKRTYVVSPVRCFLGLALTDPTDQSAKSEFFSRDLQRFSIPIMKIIHVPGLRKKPDRSYQVSGKGPDFPGTFENYVAAIIHSWQEEKDPRLHEVENALKVLGLGRKVYARLLDAAHIELLVNRLPRTSKRRKEDMVSIADVGFGVSQVLPVLVSLFAAVPGQLVYIEQPELHLHPRAQVGLATVLADAAKRGVRVVAETHSSLLLLAVQTLVAKDELDPNLVKLHWFQRGEDGVTKVHSADLDESGAFGEWPQDFGSVELEADSAYLDAVDEGESRR